MSDPSSKQTPPKDSSKFRSTLHSLFEEREVRDKRLFELLTSDDDLVTLVLRGHLVIEELLFSAIAAHCNDPEFLKKANLKFSQLIPLFRALEKLPVMNETDWGVLNELNSLRNALAHNIEPANISVRTERLVLMILGTEGVKILGNPLSSKESLKQALCHFFGKLSAIAVFQFTIEEMIVHQLKSRGTDQSQAT